ncbi:MAG TPA: Ig-like domain-containing protein [Acidimicrobiales bacterium]|nr:Ig-like domain-containing protein [Acidimicrobiales bacterium]
MVGERRRLGRRRARARRLARLAVPLALATVVVVLLVSAVAQIGPASGSYRRTVNRGYAALAGPVVARSDASGASMRSLFATATTLDRVALFAALDQLASDTAAERRQLGAITPPEPASASARDCLHSLSLRATAASSLRSALEGVLGGRTGLGRVDEPAATAAVTSAGAALVSADASWGACRRGMRHAAGSAVLPASSWLPGPGYLDEPASARLVAGVMGLRSFAPVHRLDIVAIVTDPPAVAGATVGVLPPTTTLVVRVVVADQGNVDEDGVEVGGVAQLQGGPSSPVPGQRSLDLVAGGSTTLTLPVFAVRPGSSYSLQVTAESPRSTGPGPIASGTVAVQVQAASTATVVTASPVRASPGRPVTFSAQVTTSLSGAGTLSGTVAFQDDGTTVPACAAQPLHAGTATCTTSYPASSTRAISAAYSGDAHFAGSTAPAITLKVGTG